MVPGLLMRATPSTASATSGSTLEVLLATLLAVSVILIFWSQQRYPALLKKFHAGTAIKVGGPISFDALLKVTPDMSTETRVLRTSINWLYTNRFGMYFALPFGATLMTLLASTGAPKQLSSTAGNVLCGVITGAPLGVCTNCATPVAQSLLVSGASARLTVAVMISSPSFNPVVVAMVFMLFPLPLAVLRIIVPTLLLLGLPVLVPENRLTVQVGTPAISPTILRRLLGFLKTFFRNLLRLTLLTLPWMLLAAFLGALTVELIPAYGTHLPISVFGVIGVAILGTLVPVPMALDVALAYTLYRTGTPASYVAALLCTLAPVSIYSLSALGQQLGGRCSLRLAVATAFLGSVAGIALLSFRSP